MYDAQGHHIGINDTGGVDFEIPGYYDDQLLYVDSIGAYVSGGEIISVRADSGNFTFVYRTIDSGEVSIENRYPGEGGTVVHVRYPLTEVAPGAQGHFSEDSLGGTYPILWDDDGDGLMDREILPDSVSYSGCYCPEFCDLNRDGAINPVDIVHIVNYVYKSIDGRQQIATCPGNNGDWDCSGAVNPVDVVKYVNFVYKSSGQGPCNPCAP